MGPGRRTSKFSRLVDDFLTTCEQRHVQVSRPLIEQHLRDAVAGTAQHMGVTTQTALRNYFDDHWGTQAGHLFCDQHDLEHAKLDATPDAVLPLAFAGRLVAALGQAHFFAALNTDPHLTDIAARTRAAHTSPNPVAGPPSDTTDEVEVDIMEAVLQEASGARRPRFDARTAGEASTGLGMALAHATTTDGGLAVTEVVVDGQVLGKTREVLLDLLERLAPGPRRWRACQCPGPCDEAETTDLIRTAMTEDLERLQQALDQHATPPRTTRRPGGPPPSHGGQILRFPGPRSDPQT
jgi:hypothetical protein